MSLKDKLLESKLAKQLVNFGIAGLLAFVLELLCFDILANRLFPITPVIKNLSHDAHTLIANPIAFSISVVFNYVLSLKFVFKKRTDVNGGQVFKIFVILNIIALGLNELLMLLFVDVLFNMDNMLAKILATALVMIYNFISRKIFVEDHSKSDE